MAKEPKLIRGTEEKSFSRRQFMKRTFAAGLSMSVVGTLLSACGSAANPGGTTPTTGQTGAGAGQPSPTMGTGTGGASPTTAMPAGSATTPTVGMQTPSGGALSTQVPGSTSTIGGGTAGPTMATGGMTPTVGMQGTAAPMAPVFPKSHAKATIVTWDAPQPDAQAWQKQAAKQDLQLFQEKYPWVTVNRKLLPRSTTYREAYDRALAAGNEPTVWTSFPYVDIQSRIADGSIANLNDYVQNWDLLKQGKVFDGFGKSIQNLKGEYYAVPHDAYQQGLLYNSKLVTQAGLDPNSPPKTWDEFVQWGQKLSDPGKGRFGFGLIGMEWCAWPYTNFVWLAGGQMVERNQDGSWKVGFDTDKGNKALMFWHDMVWKYKMVQKDVTQDYNALQQSFEQERIAMFWTNLGVPIDAHQKFKVPLDNFGFAGMPKAPDGRFANLTGGQVWTVSPHAKPEQRDASWAYMQFFSYDPEYLTMAWQRDAKHDALSPSPSMRTDMDSFKYATGWPKEWGEVLPSVVQNAQAEPWCPHWNDIKNLLVNPIQKAILTQSYTSDDATKALAKSASEIYGKWSKDFKQS